MPDAAGQGGAQAQADERHPALKITKTSEMRSRCHGVVTWLAPIAAATAKESGPSGSTKASSFSTGSGSHDLSGR
jgi:hypothetical protein